MIEEPPVVVKVFYCYARQDQELQNRLVTHLEALRRSGLITAWYDREILPGMDWEREIDTHLNTSDIVLLLVSPSFIASDYCYGVEMRRALERHESGETRVIPIILRPVDWKSTPISKLQVLPTDGKPVTLWRNRDKAFEDIVRGIRKAVEQILTWEDEEHLLRSEELIRSAPDLPFSYVYRAAILYKKKRYEEALTAAEQAIHLDPTFADAHFYKAGCLSDLKRHEEAVAAYEQVINLDPTNINAYRNKGYALLELRRYEEALVDFEQVIRLEPNSAIAYSNMSATLHALNRYEEALTAAEQAIRLDPTFADVYYGKAMVLEHLGRSDEAAKTRKKARQLGFSM